MGFDRPRDVKSRILTLPVSRDARVEHAGFLSPVLTVAAEWRPEHISKDQYIEQLQNPCQTEPLWPIEQPTPVFIKRLPGMLPSCFYACEFGLPDLFSANRRKLGEILFRCDKIPKSKGDAAVIIGMRAPGLWFTPSGNTLWPELATGINNHLPLLRSRE